MIRDSCQIVQVEEVLWVVLLQATASSLPSRLPTIWGSHVKSKGVGYIAVAARGMRDRRTEGMHTWHARPARWLSKLARVSEENRSLA